MIATITLKRCCTCGIEKDLIYFGVCVSQKDGLNRRCKVCQRIAAKASYQKHRVEKCQKSRESYRKDPARFRASANKWMSHPPNKVRYQMAKRARYVNNRERLLAQIKAIQASPRGKQKRDAYMKHYKAIPHVRIASRAYRALNCLISRRQGKGILELLGVASKQEFYNYIESKFKPGMTWKNHGFFGWHIDYIKPCSLYDFTKLEHLAEAFHYTNLQPLWWYENMAKGKKTGIN